MKPLPAQTEPLTVVMRVRPMNGKEFKSETKCIVQPVDDKFVVLKDPNEDSDDILRANRSREKQYIFDHVFPAETSQKEVYETIVEEKNIIDTVLSGYNCTVFAYGATGTGKTHTMLGSREDPGIMVHTLNSLFTRMEETSTDKTYTVSIGYLEIYNENVRDLLCPDSGSLELREDANGSIVISNLLDISAESTEVVLGMLRMGNTNRTSESTVANATSSRSHAILKVNIERRSRVSNVMQESHCGSLYMVDLAGSERAAVTQNRGKRLIEGAHINRSLLALANCINALGSNGSNYINYRDSKLTRILKEALGGNCKTVMIAHVSPASSSYEETRNTMLYAERSKKIRNKARQNVVDVNHHVTQYIHIISDLNHQIARLKGELNRAECGVAIPESEEVTSLCERLKGLVTDQRELRQQMLDVECLLLQNSLECQQRRTCIQDWERKREELDLASLTAPPSTVPPSPFPMLCTDPLVIDITDADPLSSQYPIGPSTSEEAHLSFESHTDPPNISSNPFCSQYPIDPSTSEESHKDPCDTLRHSSHQNDSICLKQAGNVVTTSHLTRSSPLLENKASMLVMNSTDSGNECATSGTCETSTGIVGNTSVYALSKNKPSVSIKDPSPVKPRHLVPEYRFLMSISPDSGAELSLTMRISEQESGGGGGGEGVTVVEPATVQVAREELATLEARRVKLERQHRALQRKLGVAKDSMAEIREELVCAEGILPTRKEMLDFLLLTSDMEASSMQQNFSSILLRAHLSQQASLIQQLLQHSADLLRLLERQNTSLVVEEEGRGSRPGMPDDLSQRLGEVSERQKRLAAQVAELSSINSFGVCTSMAGFKSDMCEDGKHHSTSLVSLTTTISDFHLPDIHQPNFPIPTKKLSMEASSLSFPAINSSGSIMAAPAASNRPFLPEKKQTASNHSSPLKQCEINQIVEAAKRTRDKKNAAIPGERFKRGSKQALSEKSTAARRNPHGKAGKNKPQQVVTTRSLVLGQPLPVSTVVIDLEVNDTGAMLAASESRTQLHLTDSTDSLLQGQKSRSHPHLSAVPPPPAQRQQRRSLLPTETEKTSRRTRTHARVGSVSSSKSLTEPGVITMKRKSKGGISQGKQVFVSDSARGGGVARDLVPQQEKEWAVKKKCWGATSKPLVKKIAFSNQPDTEISPHPLNSSSGVGDTCSDTTSTNDEIAEVVPQHQRQQQLKLRQREPLPHQAWRNRRKVPGTLRHIPQFTRTQQQFASRKQLSLAKVEAGSQFSNIHVLSPYLTAFSSITKPLGVSQTVHNSPHKPKPLVKKRTFANSPKETKN